MINISEELINSVAPNEGAVKNAQGLVKKKSFVNLWKSGDDTLIFGECMGSGSSNYSCSVDFINPENPVFRCSCPSRQIPCKHALGLMYAYVGGNTFKTADIPGDIIEKRDKAEKRNTKKVEETSTPKKVNKGALEKKIKTQIEGLELLEKIIMDIVRRGLGTVDEKTLDMLEEQGKVLNSQYLPGAQRMLRDIIIAVRQNENREKLYMNSPDLLAGVYSLCRKGKEHLARKLEDPEMALDGNSAMDELLGHTWQASELEAAGMVENDAELIQLFFNVYMDESKREFIDMAYWMDLGKGILYKTCNYRPFRAAKHIKEEDSFFPAARVKKLYIYPGDINKRIRWEDMSLRDIQIKDCDTIISYANKNYADVIKNIKNAIKNPLADKNPTMLLFYTRLGKIGDDYVIEDPAGKRIMLRNLTGRKEAPSIHMLHLLQRDDLKNGAVLVRFEHNIEDEKLTAQPLSVITSNGITRLVY